MDDITWTRQGPTSGGSTLDLRIIRWCVAADLFSLPTADLSLQRSIDRADLKNASEDKSAQDNRCVGEATHVYLLGPFQWIVETRRPRLWYLGN